MNEIVIKVSKFAYVLWMVWSCLVLNYEISKGQIPQTIYMYEEEAKEVLSGTQKTLDPKDVYLDFVGDVCTNLATNNCCCTAANYRTCNSALHIHSAACNI